MCLEMCRHTYRQQISYNFYQRRQFPKCIIVRHFIYSSESVGFSIKNRLKSISGVEVQTIFKRTFIMLMNVRRIRSGNCVPGPNGSFSMLNEIMEFDLLIKMGEKFTSINHVRCGRENYYEEAGT